MKAKALKLLTAFVALISLTFSPFSPPALAADVSKSSTFTGFAFEKAAVTTAMKAEIKAWITKNATSGFTLVSCTGYTGFNVKKREQEFLQTLAENRARNICNYIRSFKDVLTIQSTRGIPGDGKTSTARKVMVRIIKPDTGGDEGGGGNVVIGSCDNNLNVTMRSRISTGEFYFASINIKDIAVKCKGKVLDIYFLDAAGNQLSASTGNAIKLTSLLLSYTSFLPSAIKSNEIKSVAFELRAP